MFLVNGSLLMAPLFPRSGPGESGSPMSTVILRCYDFPSRIPGHLFVSLPESTLPSSVCVSLACARAPGWLEETFRAGSMFTRRPNCRLAPCVGVGRDLPGSQAVHPVPLPRSGTPAESTPPRLLTVSSMLPPRLRQRGLQRILNFGASAWLQHLLLTLHEWRYRHPCKACFRLAGLPLPRGSRTLWIAMKGFRLHSRSPFLDFSWRNEGFSYLAPP